VGHYCAAVLKDGVWDHHSPEAEVDAQADVDYHRAMLEAEGFVLRRLQEVMHHPDGRVAIVEMELAE
jgi:hypothetical protein